MDEWTIAYEEIMTSVGPLSPTASNTSLGQAPTIHISPSKLKILERTSEDDGHTNTAFEMNEGGEISSNEHAQFVTECGFASGSAVAAKHSIRRESGQTITSIQNTLRVPGVSHCVASTSHDLDEEFFDPSDELSGTGAMPLTSMSYGFLHPSNASPTKSLRSNWSELINLGRKDSIGSFHSDEDEGVYNDESTGPSGLSTAMSSRLKDLLFRFNSRTERFKERAAQPPTPSTGSPDAKSAISSLSLEPKQRHHRLDSFIPVAPSPNEIELKEANVEDRTIRLKCCTFVLPLWLYKLRFPDTIDPSSNFYVCWLFLVAVSFLYNASVIPLRVSFVTAEYYNQFVNKTVSRRVCPSFAEAEEVTTMQYYEQTTETAFAESTEGYHGNMLAGCHVINETIRVPRTYPGYQREDNLMYWWAFDYLCDLIYIIDIVLMRVRIRFINNGLVERDRKETRKNYMISQGFRMDCASLIPLDLLYLIPAVNYSSLVRIPRVLKIHAFWEFYERMDTTVSNAYIVRVIRTLTYMLYLIHIETCGYYAMSAYETLALNEWVFDGKGIAYVRCMYLATKTATSIGNNPRPTNLSEYSFMTAYWLSGVFVFAMLIGQFRDLYQQAYATKENYRKTMDQTLSHLKSLSIPKDLQRRVRTWFTYNWEHQKTLNENLLLDALPTKMKADLAIHVHFNTLSKVQLFQDCDKNLLFDLVLKLKPVLYLPMDYICKKGEVGTEMYIVMHGIVEVVGGPNNSMVFATLQTGSVFGEISLLALAGGNRRTADVRSKGYSQLFILSKIDFEDAMNDYPEANKLLRKRAKKLLAQNAKQSEAAKKMEGDEIIKSRQGTPKLVKTVIQMVSPKSNIPNYLGMRRRSSQHSEGHHIEDYEATTDRLLQLKETSEGLDEDFEDEIIYVEQTERELTSPEKNLEQVKEETTVQVPESPVPPIPVLEEDFDSDEDLRTPSSLSSSSSSLRREVASILASPSPPPAVPSSRMSSRAPSRAQSRPMTGQSSGSEVQTISSAAIIHIPGEHQVTCEVEVHDEVRPMTSLEAKGHDLHELSVQALLQRSFTPGLEAPMNRDIGPLKNTMPTRPKTGASRVTEPTINRRQSNIENLHGLKMVPLSEPTINRRKSNIENLPGIKMVPLPKPEARALSGKLRLSAGVKVEPSDTDKRILNTQSKDKVKKKPQARVAPLISAKGRHNLNEQSSSLGSSRTLHGKQRSATFAVVPPIGASAKNEGCPNEGFSPEKKQE